MPGMNSGLNISDPTVVAAFKTALLHQGLAALLIFALIGLVWLSLRAFLPVTARLPVSDSLSRPPAWRQVLRIGFGLLWLFDGILQAQPKMAVGLPSQVIQPAAACLAALGAGRRELGRHRPGRTTPCRLVRRLSGFRQASGCGCWPPRAGCCPGWPGSPALAGAWSCGHSAKRSAAFSRLA